MSKEQDKELLKFLKPFSDDIRKTVLWLRDFVWDLYPQANELIYDNYNALSFGWSPTDRVGHTFCSIAVGRTSMNIHFGFYRGNELTDPKKILKGDSNQYRYVLVTERTKFPRKYAHGLVKEAYHNSLKRVKDPTQLQQGKAIVKSVSAKKRTVARKTVKRKTQKTAKTEK